VSESNNNNQENQYATGNLPLAAWLYMNKINLLKVILNANRSVFVFDTSPNNKLIFDYETASAEGNVLAFFNTYQLLIRKIRESKARSGR